MLSYRTFPVLCFAPLFLLAIYLALTVSVQDSMSDADCQLTNTCFGRTKDDLANEGSTTPKITEIETTFSTQTTLTTSEITPVPLHTTVEPSKEAIRGTGEAIKIFSTALYKTIPVSADIRLTDDAISGKSQTATEAHGVTYTDRIKAGVKAQKSKRSLKRSKVVTKYLYPVPVLELRPPICTPIMFTVGQDLFYLLCLNKPPAKSLRVYEDSFPYDLVLLTFTEEIGMPRDMVGSENTKTVYVSDTDCKCIWKIDAKVSKWLEFENNILSLSVTNDDHLLVLKNSQDLLRLEIYDQDTKLVRNLSLSNDDFKGPFNAIKTPNGERIVTRSLELVSEDLLRVKIAVHKMDGWVEICLRNYLNHLFGAAKIPNADFVVGYRSEHNSRIFENFFNANGHVVRFNHLGTRDLHYNRVYLSLNTGTNYNRTVAVKRGNWNRYLTLTDSDGCGMTGGLKFSWINSFKFYFDRKKDQLIILFQSTVQFYQLDRN